MSERTNEQTHSYLRHLTLEELVETVKAINLGARSHYRYGSIASST